MEKNKTGLPAVSKPLQQLKDVKQVLLQLQIKFELDSQKNNFLISKLNFRFDF